MVRGQNERQPSGSDRGFTIIEVLVALTLIAIAAAGVADLCAIAIRSTRDARDETMATLLAGQKIEQLQSASWSSTDLMLSPPDTLASSVPGYAEYFDRHGRLLGGGAAPPPDAVYVRRWSIAAPSSGSPDTRVVRVLVATTVRASQIGPAGPRARQAGEALVVALRSGR